MPEPVLPEKPGEKNAEPTPSKSVVAGGMDALKSLF